MSWPQVRISEVTEIVSGATPKTGVSDYWGGEIAWATPADLSGLTGAYIEDTPRKITEAGLRSCATSVLPAHSVLFSSRAPIGHVAINTVPMATNQGFKSFVPDAKVLDAKFLFWWLKAHRVQLEAMGSGATFKEISKATVLRVEIPLPPLDEQKRIAAILDKADQLRQKRRQAIALLDSLTQSIFLEMFGDKSPRTKIKIVPFDEVTTRITYGFTQPMSHHANGIPILTAKNIQFGYIDYENVKYTNEADFASLTDKSKPQTGDILITKDGTIGRSAILDRDERVCINQSVCVVKLKKDAVQPLYILHYLLSSGIQSRIDSMKKGNSIPHLQITELAKFPIPLPSNALQLEFISRLSSIESARKAAAEAQYKSESLFSSLQHRAFSGQL